MDNPYDVLHQINILRVSDHLRDAESMLDLIIKLSGLLSCEKFYERMRSYFPFIRPDNKRNMLQQIVDFMRVSYHPALCLQKGTAKDIPIDVLNLISHKPISDDDLRKRAINIDLEKEYIIKQIILKFRPPSEGYNINGRVVMVLGQFIHYFTRVEMRHLTYKFLYRTTDIGRTFLSALQKDYSYPEIEEDLKILINRPISIDQIRSSVPGYLKILRLNKDMDLEALNDDKDKYLLYSEDKMNDLKESMSLEDMVFFHNMIDLSIFVRFLSFNKFNGDRDIHDYFIDIAIKKIYQEPDFYLTEKLTAILWTIVLIKDSFDKRGMKIFFELLSGEYV